MVDLRSPFRHGLHVVPSQKFLLGSLRHACHVNVLPSDTGNLQGLASSAFVHFTELIGHLYNSWNRG